MSFSTCTDIYILIIAEQITVEWFLPTLAHWYNVLEKSAKNRVGLQNKQTNKKSLKFFANNWPSLLDSVVQTLMFLFIHAGYSFWAVFLEPHAGSTISMWWLYDYLHELAGPNLIFPSSFFFLHTSHLLQIVNNIKARCLS